ncbi:MAG: hypothetical protein IJT25_00710 [Clostridia bacterium]|nr:hypothetical protein [Clostridia bacterium]
MGNAERKTINSKSILARVLMVLILFVASITMFVGCDAGIETNNASFDDSGNLRIEAPELYYNYAKEVSGSSEKEIDPNITGSISWNFSYYVSSANTYYPFADEQYVGQNFYTANPASIFAKKTLIDNDRQWIVDHTYRGATPSYNGTNWIGDNGIILYRLVPSNINYITYPSYEVVVDGTPITFYLKIDSSVYLYEQDASGKTVLNTNAIYFTDSKDGGNRYSSDYIRIEKSESKYSVGSVEQFLPQEKYVVVFNPKLRGTATTRSIKVRAISNTDTRGNSAYSSTLTYTAVKLAFSVYSPNSADDLKNVGYLTYNENAYYFNKISKTITPNPNDGVVTYLEGYFPEGRVVNVSRNLTENSDYALSSFTTNKKATGYSALANTLPSKISSYFNFINEEISRTAVLENENANVFNVVTYYNGENTNSKIPFISSNAKVSSLNKNNLFYETLNIAKTSKENDVLNLVEEDKSPSTITVVANRNLNGFTFYANFTKVKNFTQSGTVFAGDDFFNSNSNHFLDGYTIGVYAIGVDRNTYHLVNGSNYGVYKTDTTDVYSLTDIFDDGQVFTPIIKLDGGTITKETQTITLSKDDGRTISITININGSNFSVLGLEHNMCLIFSKQDSDNNIQYSFHNATMQNVNFNGSITKTLFVEQSDKVLCGVIGTEFEESSSINVVVKRATAGTAEDLANSNVPYEIIKTVSTKEDMHGYVTTNIILSIVVPENSLLTAYNLNTPEISSHAVYKASGKSNIYYNATEDNYYTYNENAVSESALTFDSARKNIFYNNRVFTYSYRDSSVDSNNKVTYNTYYNSLEAESEYKYCIIVSVSENTTSYKLRQYKSIKMYYSTNAYENLCQVEKIDSNDSTKNYTYFTSTSQTFITSEALAKQYLQATTEANGSSTLTYINLYDVNSGLITQGLIMDNGAGDFNGNPNVIYMFDRDANLNIVITTYSLDKDSCTLTDSSVNVVAYKSNLTYTYGDGENEEKQDVYFYYDISSIKTNGEEKYYYTAPIGMSNGAVDSWFYKFDTDSSEVINSVKLGSDIIANRSDTNNANLYNIMGEKIVGHFYYYTLPVLKTNAQVRQYSGTTEINTGYKLRFTNDVEYVSNKTGETVSHESGTYADINDIFYNEGYSISVDITTESAFKKVNLNKNEYRVYFDPSDFSFKVLDVNGADVSSTFSIWDFKTRDSFYTANGNKVSLPDNTYTFSLNGTNVSDFKASGDYICSGFSGGFTYQISIQYSAIELESRNYVEVKCVKEGSNYKWVKIENLAETTIHNSDLTKYAFFPEISIKPNTASAEKVYLALKQSTNAYKIIDTDEISFNLLASYKVDGTLLIDGTPSADNIVTLDAVTDYGLSTTVNREAYILNEKTNQKTQIMIWGKYIPTSNPKEPIIYPTFSNLIDDYDDALSYIFGSTAYFYDIDYSSEKAIREGFMGVNFLSGSPYPNPVIYLSVRHKINEYSTVEIAVDIKEAYFVEIMADKLENNSSSMVENFETYSFKDTMANIDVNDYINNIYYVLYKQSLTSISAFKLDLSDITNPKIDSNFAEKYPDGKILKINEIAVNEETGLIYFTDKINANGEYENLVYVETTEEYAEITITTGTSTRFFRTLSESECFAWRTSKKFIKDAGYFDVHGYSIDKLTGEIVLNSGELDINEVCKELNGIVLGSVYNQKNNYNYDKVIIAGTTSAYRTSLDATSYTGKIDALNSDIFGFSKMTSIPILDSFDAKSTYFLKGKECAMLIADPLVETEQGTSYRFLEWRVYSRYNSGIIYYDQYETEVKLGINRFANTLCFSPENSGYYIILPVYERIFNISIATEVENGPQNQGGSVVVYYKDGFISNLDETIKTDVFSIEYLKTLLGAKYGYYYKEITYTPYAYFGSNNEELEVENEIFLSSSSLIWVFEYGTNAYGVFSDGENITIEPVAIQSPSINASYTLEDLTSLYEDANKVKYKKVFPLAFTGTRYSININSNRIFYVKNVAFSAQTKLAMPSANSNITNDITYNLYEQNGYLYVINGVSTQVLPGTTSYSILFDAESPIARVYEDKINVVSTKPQIHAIENDYYISKDGGIMSGELAYDENGNLETHLKYKTTYIDRGSEVMLVALPDEGYRLLDWYDENGVRLASKFESDSKYYNEDERIIKAKLINGNYYYYEDEVEEGESLLVPQNMLSKVRGYYINTGSSAHKNYVQVFYSASYDNYYYDSTFTVPVEEKYLYATINGRITNIVSVLTHYDAILASETVESDGTSRYFLNNMEVYKNGDNFYTSYHTGNITVSGNTLVIKSIHTNIKFVAVYREIYKALILTDDEEDFGVSIAGVYYYSSSSSSNNDSTTDLTLANRINENGSPIGVITLGDGETESSIAEKGNDLLVSGRRIDANKFTLFVSEDEEKSANILDYSTISNLINSKKDDEYNGYIATEVLDFGFSGNAYQFITNETDNKIKNLKKALAPEGETLALDNLYFDTNTTLLIVVRTAATSPLSMHTLGLAIENNLVPIIYPTQKYISDNLTKAEYISSSSSGLASSFKANYLYYVFKLTLDRNPENEYADLLTHETRTISTTLDILTGRYNDFYSKYYDVILTLNSNPDENGNIVSNSVKIRWTDYFNVLSNGSTESYEFKNGISFVSNVFSSLVEDIIKDENTKNIMINNISGLTNARYRHIVDFIDYLNTDILGYTKNNLIISDITLSSEYLNSISSSLKTLKTKTASNSEEQEILNSRINNIVSEIENLVELNLVSFNEITSEISAKSIRAANINNLLSAETIYNSLNTILVKIDALIGENDANKDKLLDEPHATRVTTIENSKVIETEEDYNSLKNYYYYRFFPHTLVGDGSVNIINLSSIKLYTFSISSLTIDGFDADGKPIYASEENSHKLGNDNGEFVFYTGVGTNGRTYVGSITPETNKIYYYNGKLVSSGALSGMEFTNKYVDLSPDYQTDKLNNFYVYKDFMLAENTIFLMEGLKDTTAKNGYTFMGWYMQKHITKIPYRFFDLDGNLIETINTSVNFGVVKDSNGNLAVYDKTAPLDDNGNYKILLVDKDHFATIKSSVSDETIKKQIYYVDEQTLTLYHLEYVASSLALLKAVEPSKYQYREWSSLELVSSSYKYPLVAVANSDTIISAIFKRNVDVNFSYNPIEASVNTSASVDSFNKPLKYTTIKTKNGETTTLGVYENKEDAYNAFTTAYEEDKGNYYSINISGKFYIDATPTFTITPVGGYRLKGIYNEDNIITDISANKTQIIFSNENTLGTTSTQLVYDCDNALVGSFDNTNLAGVVYATVVLNNIINTSDLSITALNLSAKFEKVVLVYTQIEGFSTINNQTKNQTPSTYNFIIYNGSEKAFTVNGTSAEGLSSYENIYFDSRYLVGSLSLINAYIDTAKYGSIDAYTLLNAGIMEEGFIEDWLLAMCVYVKELDYASENNLSSVNAIESSVVEKLTQQAKESSLYKELLSYFAKTSANKTYYLSLANTNLVLYGYFDNTFTDSTPILVQTIKNDGENNFDHWYLNAQMPSSISGEESALSLNDNVSFPTIHEIKFETDNSEYNKKYVLSKNNLVYFMRGVFEENHTVKIGFSFSNNIKDEFKTLEEMGAINPDNSFNELISFTYTGIKYASESSDLNINTTTSLSETSDSTNGIISTKFHTGHYGTGTQFTLNLTNKFIVIENDNTYENGEFVAGDIYAFIGYMVNGKLVSTDLHYTTTDSNIESINALFVKINKVEITNIDGGSFINMQKLNIQSTVALFNQTKYLSEVYGYYEAGNYYYAICGQGIVFSVTPDDGYVLENVYYTDPENTSNFKSVENITSNNSFKIEFLVDSIVKLDLKEGFLLVVDQLVFKNYYETTKGVLLTNKTLYEVYKNDNTNKSTAPFLFAKGSNITLTYLSNDDYSFIGYYINNKLIDSSALVKENGKISYTFEITGNTVVEIRLVKNINLRILSYVGNTTSSISRVEVKNKTTALTLYNGDTPVNNGITFKAGEIINANIISNLNAGFVGWFMYAENNGTSEEKLISTNVNFDFTINSDDPFLNDNTATIIAKFSQTRTFNITKELEKVAHSAGANENKIYDLIISYTNKYGNEITTNLGTASSTTINALVGTKINTTAIIEQDQLENYYFEGYYTNGFISTYEEDYSIEVTSSLSSTTATNIEANFTQGLVLSLTRRLNDDPYLGSLISINANYNPAAIQEGKTLNSNKESIRVGLKESEGNATDVIIVGEVDEENEISSSVVFIGYFINNIDASTLSYCDVSGAKLTILNAKQNLTSTFNSDVKNILIEARYALTASITFRRIIDDSASLDAELNKHLSTSMLVSTLSSTGKIESTLVSLQEESFKTIPNVYKNTTLALTASKYAGYEFIGFRVKPQNSQNSTFITKFDENNTDDIVYYYLDNEYKHNGNIDAYNISYTIEAYYSKCYNIVYVGTVMGSSSASVTFNPYGKDAINETTINPAYVKQYKSEVEKVNILSSAGGYEFIGYYDYAGNKISKLGTEEPVYAKDLINTVSSASYKNNQIFIEARYAKTVSISVESFDKFGNKVNEDNYNLPYGVSTTISSSDNSFKAWGLPSLDGSNRIVAYYSTEQDLEILPLENKTYYALCDNSVHIGEFTNSSNVYSVLIGNSTTTGYLPSGPYDTPVDDNLKTKYLKITLDSSEWHIDSVEVDYKEAYKAGFAFIGWVGSAKYAIGGDEYYFPISNNLKLNTSEHLFNNVYAVFAPTSNFNVSLSGDEGSYTAIIQNSTTYSSPYPLFVDNAENGGFTLKFFNDHTSHSISATTINDDYIVNISGNDITAKRKNKIIDLPYYVSNDESRVAYLEDISDYMVTNDTPTNNIADLVSAKNITNTLNSTSNAKPTISIGTYQNGTIKIYDSSNTEISNLNDITLFDNLKIESIANENYYLDHYIVSRKFDYNTRLSDLDYDGSKESNSAEINYIYLPHFALKILDGEIEITPVFKKNFSVVIDKSKTGVNDCGNTNLVNTTSENNNLSAKQLDIVADEDYRISAIIINGNVTSFDYNESLANNSTLYTNGSDTIVTLKNSAMAENADDANRTYLTNLSLLIESDQDVDINVIYNKVVSLNIYDGRTLAEGKEPSEVINKTIYVDNSSINTSTLVKTNKPITPSAINSIIENIYEDETLTTKFLAPKQNQTFIGYFYNNKAIPASGLDISNNSAYDLVATFATSYEIEFYIALVDENNNQINDTLNNANKSVYNTPIDGFSATITRLKDADSMASDVETSALLKDDGDNLAVYNTTILQFNDNDNFVLNVYGNNYFVFVGWFNQNNQKISSSEAINPNAYTGENNLTKLTARYKEEVRTITVKQNYLKDAETTPQTNLYIAKSSTETLFSLNDIASDTANKYVFNIGARNVTIRRNNIGKKVYFNIRYSVASSELQDSFYLIDKSFAETLGNYEYTNDIGQLYRFKNITRENDMLLSNYTSGMPFGTINLEDFYTNQDLNFNVFNMFKLQYTIAISDINASDLNDIALKVYENGILTKEIKGLAPDTTYNNASINMWITEGTLVTITATPTDAFCSIGYSTSLPLFSSTGNAFSYDESVLLESTKIIGDLTKETWENNYTTKGFSDLYNLFNNIYEASNLTAKVNSISAYSYVAKSSTYFIADYYPIFTYSQKYINAAMASTDTLSNLTATSGNSYSSTFAITQTTPDAYAIFTYNSDVATILNVLDKNNNIIKLSGSGLTTFNNTTDDLSEFIENFEITSKQTDVVSVTDNYSENGLKLITEQLANVSIKAGYFDAVSNYINNYKSYIFNKYRTLYDNDFPLYLAELAKLKASTEDIDGTLTASYNDLLVSLFSEHNNETISSYETDYTDLNDEQIILNSYAQSNLRIGDLITVKTKPNAQNSSNYFFKGFIIVNSASVCNTNTFASGKQNEEISNYTSYQLIALEDLGSPDDDGYYSYSLRLSGDTQIVALYEKLLLQVQVRLKSLPETLRETYQNFVSSAGDNRDSLLEQTINGVNVLTDKNSVSGKLTSNSQLIVQYNSPAIVTTLNYPFSSLIGYTTAQDYSPSTYLIEGGESKTLDDVNNIFKDAKEVIKLAPKVLQLINPSYARNNLYINKVTDNMIIGAYFSEMSYTISIKIQETELVVVDNGSGSEEVGFVYIKNYNDNGEVESLDEILTIKDENFTPEFDEHGLITNITNQEHTLLRLSKIRQDLISPIFSLTPSGEFEEDGQTPIYYLMYQTNKPVINATYDDISGKYTYSKVKITFASHPTDEMDEDGNIIMNRLSAEEILSKNLFFAETNIALNGSHEPQNVAIYFDASRNALGTEISVKKNLITISQNNKRAIDINNMKGVTITPLNHNNEPIYYNDRNEPVDALGEPMEDSVVTNYRIDVLITALGSSGFPSIKIKMNSPSGDTTIVPYSYDNSDYLNKLKNLTEQDLTSNLSIWANPNNLDLNYISGFYNEVYKNTNLFTDQNFKQENFNFDLTLVYAKLSTPVRATLEVETDEGYAKSYDLTNKTNSKTYEKDINAIKKELTRYELFVLSNGAYIQNKIFELFELITKNETDKALFNNCYNLLDFMNNFARATYFKENVKTTYTFFTNETETETNALLKSYYSNDDIMEITNIKQSFENVITRLHKESLLPESFSLATLFNVRRENIFGYFTGQTLEEDLLTNLVLDNDGKAITLEKFENKFMPITYTIDNSGNEFTYDKSSTSSFNEFYVTTGDMCIMVSELAQKYQRQQNIEYNRSGSVKKAIQAYLYYNEASMKFYEEEKLGRFTYTYKNTSPLDSDLDTNKLIDTWSKLRRIMSAIFNKVHEFDDTFITTLTTATAPTGIHLSTLGTTGLKSVVYVYNAKSTQSPHRIPIIKVSGWEGGQMPTDDVWATVGTVTAGVIIVAGIVALTIATGGLAGGGAIAGATGFAKFLAVLKVAGAVALKAVPIIAGGVIIGTIAITLISGLTAPLFNINWQYLNSITA